MIQTLISVFVVGIVLGFLSGVLLNSSKINKVIKEAKEQMKRSQELIEENSKLLRK